MQSVIPHLGTPGPSACLAFSKRSLPQPRLIKAIVRATAEDADGWEDEVWRRPRGLGELPVGSERGEAFSEMRPAGGIVRLDVDVVNDRLRIQGALRHRIASHPEQAHALIISLDSLVANTTEALVAAWNSLAIAKGIKFPQDVLQRLVYDNVSPERIAMHLGFCSDMKSARLLVNTLSDEYLAAVANTAKPAPGLRELLELASSYEMPCAAVSQLDRRTCRRVLESTHLHDHLTMVVTAESELETQAQALLSAAMQLQRPPNSCVFFCSDPKGITAAHNASMKAIALITPDNPAYRLRAADRTVTSLAQIGVMHVRSLFGAAGTELGSVKKERSNDKNPRKRGLATGTI